MTRRSELCSGPVSWGGPSKRQWPLPRFILGRPLSPLTRIGAPLLLCGFKLSSPLHGAAESGAHGPKGPQPLRVRRWQNARAQCPMLLAQFCNPLFLLDTFP